MRSVPLPEHKEELKRAKEDGAKELRNDLIREVYQASELTYEEIGNLPSVDLLRARVGEIVRQE